tara:strand:- start:271 stop:495 length:225 start_codon:yes stop_codon:yes gene_type:complete
MNLGQLFLNSLSSGVITNNEMDWITTHQTDFSRIEEAMAIKLGRYLDRGLIQIGCRLRAPLATPEAYQSELEKL